MKCVGCIYYRWLCVNYNLSLNHKCCHYILDTGNSRVIPPDECYKHLGTRYKPTTKHKYKDRLTDVTIRQATKIINEIEQGENNMNTLNVIGRMVKDIEKSVVGEKKTHLAKFSLAVQDGKEVVYFLDCEAWGEHADFASKYLSKGMRLGVTGKLTQQRWVKDGKNYSKYVVVVQEFTFCESAGKKEKLEVNEQPKQQIITTDEDIPF